MKRAVLSCLLCVFFSLVSQSVGYVFAYQLEEITFNYHNKVFIYTLTPNIKHSNQFDLNIEINKYDRFGTIPERRSLLKELINKGIDKEISLCYLFPNINHTLDLISKNIFKQPKDAHLSINSSTKEVFNIQPHTVGIQMDRNSLINEICSSFINEKPMNFIVPIIKTTPKTSSEDLKNFTHLRADFSTNISNSSQDRKHNIKTALNTLNKTQIAPGEIFSFNNTVGRRTAENGYRQAKIIINNEFVDGIGGGVCQVSSTLYNAALLSGLEIIEANKHSKQVAYISPGFDAMVNFGSSDLRFRNNTQEKITIITNFSNSTARIRIFGQALNNTTYKLSSETLNIKTPEEEILIDHNQEYVDKVFFIDEYFILKKPSVGMEIKSYRDKYINNKLSSRELVRHDKYKVQNAVKVFGSHKRDSQTTKESTDHLCA